MAHELGAGRFGQALAALACLLAPMLLAIDTSGRRRLYRAFGWAFLVLGAGFALADVKAYFLSSAYPVLFAGGACVLDAASAKGLLRWARPAYIGLLVAAGLFLIPVTLPVLPEDAGSAV